MSDSKQIDYYNHNNFLFYCNPIWRLVAILNFKQNSESGNRNELSDLKASGKRFLYYYFPFSRAKEDIALNISIWLLAAILDFQKFGYNSNLN